MLRKTGRILNAKLRIGDSMIMINNEFPEYGCHGPTAEMPSPVTIHLYVEDVDKWFDRAVAAGAVATMPLSDAFWGDRFGAREARLRVIGVEGFRRRAARGTMSPETVRCAGSLRSCRAMGRATCRSHAA